MSGASPASRLRVLAATSMVGTDHGGASVKPERLLDDAAVQGARARAGLKAARVEGRVPACPPESVPIAGPAPMATLMRLLSDPDVGLLTEWAELAHARGVRVADSAVPALLDWWSRQPKRPDVVFALLGAHGAWLASLNEVWRKPASGAEIPANADEVWQTGAATERAALLLTIRRQDPTRALALVQSTWAHDGAEERRRFIEVLGEGCSMVDEPFLESALDDRSKVVRRAASSVLGRIPESRLRARMNERARSILAVERQRGILKRGVKITLSPPKEFDKAWERDAIEEQAASGIGKRAWWMRQILSAADLSVWTEATGLDPAGVLEAINGDDYFGDALEALSEVAAVRADGAWCKAIVHRLLEERKVQVHELRGLWQNLSAAQREPLLLDTAKHKKFSAIERWSILASAEHRWSSAFSDAALCLLAADSPGKGDVWSLHDAVERISRWIVPEQAERFAEMVSAILSEDSTASLRKSIDRVRLRADMHKEFRT